MDYELKDGVIRDKGVGCKVILKRFGIALLSLVIVMAISPLCCLTFRFPPQIFGKNEDHFRAFVVDPIPESVEIRTVEFSDLIVHPDVTYYFQFVIDQQDIHQIITEHSLEPSDSICLTPTSSPEWWNFPEPDRIDVYQFIRQNGYTVCLCYDPESRLAYFVYFSY